MVVFKSGPVTINSTTIAEFSSRRISRAITSFVNHGGGHIHPSYLGMMHDGAVCSFTSPAVKSILDITGISGVALTSADIWYILEVHGAHQAGTTSHDKVTINDGMVVPRRIRAGNDGEAEIDFDIVMAYDGSNAPLIYTADQSLPASSDTCDEKFVVGDIDIAGTLYDIQSLDFDFGIELFISRTKGEVAPRHISIRRQRPVITFTTFDVTNINTFGINGATKAAQVYLKKCTEGGTRVADATQEHIQFTIAASYCRPGDISDSEGEAETEIVIEASYDGTNAIMVLDTTAAIA